MVRTLIFLTLIGLSGCTSGPFAVDEPDDIDVPAEPDPLWFACESTFNCVAVLDGNCRQVGVNQRYATTFQDWSRARLRQTGELRLCEPAIPAQEVARCQAGRCTVGVPIGRSGGSDSRDGAE